MQNDYLRQLKITHVRDVLSATGALGLIAGNTEDIIGGLGEIVDTYPEARKNRSDQPDFCLTDWVHEIAAVVTGTAVRSVYSGTCSYSADR